MSQEQPTGPIKAHDWSQFIVQHAPAGVVTLDGQGGVTDLNPGAEDLTGSGGMRHRAGGPKKYYGGRAPRCRFWTISKIVISSADCWPNTFLRLLPGNLGAQALPEHP